MEPGKLFIGGISWDTNEDRLRDYFQNFGEVVEAVIMKDRSTGRARGFGFVIYADPAVAERVVKQKHMLDGRTVEAKKAVPRDDSNTSYKSSSSIHGSPGPVRTKKIFVGGLPSSITESEFKRYFDQFGIITDVVVMYDHNTQRPRGFGFITYDSEEAVERALVKTFHELNRKMVEVKRAVPKESSAGAGPIRCPFNGSNFGVSRVSGLLSGAAAAYSPSLVGGGGFGIRLDDRPSPVSVARAAAFPSFGTSAFGTFNSEPRINGESGTFISNFTVHDRGGSSTSYRHNSFADYEGIRDRDGNCLTSSSTSWNLWGNGSHNNGYGAYSHESNTLVGFKNGDNIGAHPLIGSEAVAIVGQSVGIGSFYSNENLSHGRRDPNLSFRAGLDGKNGNAIPTPTASSYSPFNIDREAANFDGFYSNKDDMSWVPSSSEFKGSGPFEFGLGNAAADLLRKNPALCW
ncbi:hypothetical protein Dimus_033043 [Dionaea muscipula]